MLGNTRTWSLSPARAVRLPTLQSAGERSNGDASTALKLYLREVGQVNLLTPEEQVALANRAHAGDEAARDHLIRANLRLVVKIAYDYEKLGLPLLDLISEGNIGLIEAVEKFDPARGARLSSCSAWRIKQSICRALAKQSRAIRLPVNAVGQADQLRKASSRAGQQHTEKNRDGNRENPDFPARAARRDERAAGDDAS
jgi:RNA polymerase primary sigma factor